MIFVYCFLIFFLAVCYNDYLDTKIKLAREATRLAELQMIAAGHAIPPRDSEAEEKKAKA